MWLQSGQDLFQSLLLVRLPVKWLTQGGTKGRKLGTGHIVGAQPSIQQVLGRLQPAACQSKIQSYST